MRDYTIEIIRQTRVNGKVTYVAVLTWKYFFGWFTEKVRLPDFKEVQDMSRHYNTVDEKIDHIRDVLSVIGYGAQEFDTPEEAIVHGRSVLEFLDTSQYNYEQQQIKELEIVDTIDPRTWGGS